MTLANRQPRHLLNKFNLVESPTVRLLISPCRSGSTAFMHAMSQNPQVQAMYQPIKTSMRETGYPDYSFFDGSHKIFKDYPNKVFVIKETIGHANVAECTLEVFPNPKAVIYSKPVYLFREPVETWNSWKKHNLAGNSWQELNLTELEGKSNLNLFLKSYSHVYQSFKTSQLISPEVSCLTREHLLRDCKRVLQILCRKWDISFSNSMIDWEKSFDDNDNFTCTNIDKKLFEFIQTDLKKSRTLTYVENENKIDLVTQEERKEIEKKLSPLYEKVREWSALYYPID